MKFTAEIDVMPLKALLDPQGKAVGHGLSNMGLKQIGNVRIGKHITLKVEQEQKKKLKNKVDEACKNFFQIQSWNPTTLCSMPIETDRHPDICNL